MSIQLTATGRNDKTVMLQITPELHDRIKAAAKHYKTPAAAAMRQILEQGINEVEANIA